MHLHTTPNMEINWWQGTSTSLLNTERWTCIIRVKSGSTVISPKLFNFSGTPGRFYVRIIIMLSIPQLHTISSLIHRSSNSAQASTSPSQLSLWPIIFVPPPFKVIYPSPLFSGMHYLVISIYYNYLLCPCRSFIYISHISQLLSGHGLSHGIHCIDFLSLLAYGTGCAEPYGQAILNKWSWYPFLFSDFASNLCPADNVSDGDEHHSTTKAAILSHLLCNLSSHNAWAAPGA